MIRLAARALCLAAAVAVTTGATAALTTYGVWRLPADRCHLGPSWSIRANIYADSGLTLPPPLPRFIQPRAASVRAPQIVCEVPADPTTVTDCAQRREAE